ncbi:HamA C-terminal domain-containing protein [Flavobacterium sp. 25HG05S-40]|uniref:HamA C-terminal domain-containing protein n=1 Tax=Flavobacterium sp. 25HG05S-40 TaxID=3458682 RepID=UPI0040445705
MDRIEKAINSLLVDTKKEIFSRIEEVSFEFDIEKTSSKGYCYALKTDGNDNLRLEDLIEFIDSKIVDYAIPKKEIDKAIKHLNETGSTSKILNLRRQAETLFTELERTGEGGELLLYILALEILKIPQLISKMSLKTSGQLHYQGSDGIHVKYNSNDKTLDLYWGESKMYEDVNAAINKCFKSLNGFLLDPLSYSSTQERDLLLITQNINNNVNNPEFEELIVEYFDKDSEMSNRLVYKGICFIGYDMKAYKELNKTKTIDNIKDEILNELQSHYGKISERIKKFPSLDTKEIHIFLMPFPSVSEFRKYYLETLKV